MEKLHAILGHARKHHFWLLCVVVALLALIGWMQASAHLSSATTEQFRAVNEKFEKVRRVSSEENPPNDRWKAELDKLVVEVREKVYELWKQEHAQQKEKILRWPTELGPKFLDFVQNNGPKAEIPRALCQVYWNYVRDEFPKLREIVKAQDPDEERNLGTGIGGGGIGGSRFTVGGGVAQRRVTEGAEGVPVRKEKPYVVEWEASDQQRIKEELNVSEPNSKQVRELQEDLWVYRALLQVIANVNEGSTGQFNAKVKQLQRMAIGMMATEEFKVGNASGQIYVPPKPEGAAAEAPVEGAVYGGAGGGGATGTDLTTSAEQSPDAGRYVDALGKPLATLAEDAELKRMPVYLKLVMDQRHLHRLLAECANSPLPIEVRQLRVKSLQEVPGGGMLFDTSTAGGSSRPPSSFGGGGSRFSVGGGPSRFSVGGGGGSRFTTPTAPSASGGSTKDDNPNAVEVELHGIICIFNPPDKDKLEVVAATAAQEAQAVPAEGQPPPTATAPADAAQPPAGQPAAAPMNPVPAPTQPVPATAPQQPPPASESAVPQPTTPTPAPAPANGQPGGG